jgi:hypothetical protein
MMIIVITLIYTVSLELELSACVIIHNQCPSIKLISPVYFGNGAVCPRLYSQQIDIGTETKSIFEINATQDEFEGALLYKLQRYDKSDDQSDMATSTTETNEKEAKCLQMLVTWKLKDSKPFVYVVLVEHTKEFTWNEDGLRKLYYGNHDKFKKYDDTTSETWFMDDNMALKMITKVRGLKGNFELSISISEEERDDHAMRPLRIDLTR